MRVTARLALGENGIHIEGFGGHVPLIGVGNELLLQERGIYSAVSLGHPNLLQERGIRNILLSDECIGLRILAQRVLFEMIQCRRVLALELTIAG